VNVLHTRKPTHLNETTSDNIDEHAYIHESKGIATATIALIIPTTRDQSQIISCQLMVVLLVGAANDYI